jgi:hypothetical protein
MKRVFFIGNGYECIKFVYVEAETNAEAFLKAEEWYNSNNQKFDYIELEIGT